MPPYTFEDIAGLLTQLSSNSRIIKSSTTENHRALQERMNNMTGMCCTSSNPSPNVASLQSPALPLLEAPTPRALQWNCHYLARCVTELNPLFDYIGCPLVPMLQQTYDNGEQI